MLSFWVTISHCAFKAKPKRSFCRKGPIFPETIKDWWMSSSAPSYCRRKVCFCNILIVRKVWEGNWRLSSPVENLSFAPTARPILLDGRQAQYLRLLTFDCSAWLKMLSWPKPEVPIQRPLYKYNSCRTQAWKWPGDHWSRKGYVDQSKTFSFPARFPWPSWCCNPKLCWHIAQSSWPINKFGRRRLKCSAFLRSAKSAELV